MMSLPWATNEEPLFINEIGTKWWLDDYTTKFAISENGFGISLPDVTCYFIELPDGYRSRALVTQKDGILYENQSLEAVASYIDVLKMLKRDYEINPPKPSKKK